MQPSKHRFKKTYIVLVVALAIIVTFFLPIVQIDVAKQGQQLFTLNVTTENTLSTLNQWITLTPMQFNYLNVNLSDTSTLVLDGKDWRLVLHPHTKTITTEIGNVTRYNPPSTRLERTLVGFYVVMDVDYTDKKTGIHTNDQRVLLSQNVDGVFDATQYQQNAQNIPLTDYSFAVGSITITNKNTNVTQTTFEVDSDGIYVPNAIAGVDYDIKYTTDISSTTSPLSYAIANLNAPLIAALISAVSGVAVTLLKAFFDGRGGLRGPKLKPSNVNSTSANLKICLRCQEKKAFGALLSVLWKRFEHCSTFNRMRKM